MAIIDYQYLAIRDNHLVKNWQLEVFCAIPGKTPRLAAAPANADRCHLDTMEEARVPQEPWLLLKLPQVTFLHRNLTTESVQNIEKYKNP